MHGFLHYSVIALYGFISLVHSTPLTFMLSDNNGRQMVIPYYNTKKPIERSDEYSSTGYDYGNQHGSQSDGGFQPSEQYGTNQDYSESFKNFDNGGHENFDQGSHGGFDETAGAQGYNHDIHNGYNDNHGHGDYNDYHGGDNDVHSVPVSEHVEVTKPIAVPVYKNVGIPVPQQVKIHIPYPMAVLQPQPYPVAVPVKQPVPIQIVKTVAKPVTKKVPVVIEKHIPVQIDKPVPFEVIRHIPVPHTEPFAIKIPVYKTIHHHTKSHHGR